MDSYYQPDEPWAEYEEVRCCDTCTGDTWHMVYLWPGRTVEAECRECGTVTDLEE